MILQETIDKVYDLNIVDIIGDYVELKRAGSNYKGLSPFASERTPSFMVSPAKQIFKCFSSGKGGKGINFIMELEHLDYPDAIRLLCKKFSIECLETEVSNEEKQLQFHKQALGIISTVASKYYQDNLFHLPEALKYVQTDRALSQEIINKFEIGFAPNTLSGLTNSLINAGYNWQLAVEASVLGYQQEKNRLYDRFRNRVMFPIKNITGNIIGFGGRTLDENPFNQTAKYVNSSDSLIYNKSEVLYGIFESKAAIVKENCCFLSEGYMDVIQFHEKKVENIVASSGTSLTINQVKLIKRLTKNVIVMFDSDSAGIQASIRGIDILLAEEMNVKVLILPDKQDPDDFARTRDHAQIMDFVNLNCKDFVMFKLNYLLDTAKDDLSLRSNAIMEVISSIAKIPNIIQREVYLKECARTVDMHIDSLRQMMKSIITDDAEFGEATIASFQEHSRVSKIYLQEQCERKILQYVLAYGTYVLNFKEVEIETYEVEGKIYHDDIVVEHKRSVLEKVIFELDNDEISFSNPLYLQIFEKAKLIDLSNFYLLQAQIEPESFFVAEQMRNEEIMMNNNSFVNQNNIGKDIVNQELLLALEKSINESLLFYKTIYIENLIEDQAKQEIPDMEFIQELTALLVKIKHGLNLI